MTTNAYEYLEKYGKEALAKKLASMCKVPTEEMAAWLGEFDYEIDEDDTLELLAGEYESDFFDDDYYDEVWDDA